MRVNEIAGHVLDASIHIHQALGPGLLESVYREILARELRKRGLQVQAEMDVPFEWDGTRLELGFRADLIVEDKVIVELKAQESILPVHSRQVLTYLKATGLSVGLLMNFGAPVLKDGFKRIVLDYRDED
ncbi:MAG: GxxExxY protein [bacterium]|nr:GxxExxY protein [bacterium]